MTIDETASGSRCWKRQQLICRNACKSYHCRLSALAQIAIKLIVYIGRHATLYIPLQLILNEWLLRAGSRRHIHHNELVETLELVMKDIAISNNNSSRIVIGANRHRQTRHDFERIERFYATAITQYNHFINNFFQIATVYYFVTVAYVGAILTSATLSRQWFLLIGMQLFLIVVYRLIMEMCKRTAARADSYRKIIDTLEETILRTINNSRQRPGLLRKYIIARDQQFSQKGWHTSDCLIMSIKVTITFSYIATILAIIGIIHPINPSPTPGPN